MICVRKDTFMCVWVCQTLLDIVCVERANTCFGRLHVPEPAKPELWKLGGSRFSLAFYRSSPLTISGSLPVFVFFCSCSFSLSASFSFQSFLYCAHFAVSLSPCSFPFLWSFLLFGIVHFIFLFIVLAPIRFLRLFPFPTAIVFVLFLVPALFLFCFAFLFLSLLLDPFLSLWFLIFLTALFLFLFLCTSLFDGMNLNELALLLFILCHVLRGLNSQGDKLLKSSKPLRFTSRAPMAIF